MKVAVVGAGVAGLAAADKLQAWADVTLFEAQRRLGGHSDSHAIHVDGKTYSIDSGFIMWEPARAPGFSAWLDELGVPTRAAEAGLGVHDEVSGLQFGTHSTAALLCQRRNVMAPKFLGLLQEMRRLHGAPLRAVEEADTLADWLTRQGFREPFVSLYALPLCRALWSLDPQVARTVPARYVVPHLVSSRLLPFGQRPAWRVFQRGAGSYVDAFVERFAGGIRGGEAVRSIARSGSQIVLTTAAGRQVFDAVVLACHSHEALALLEDASPDERDVLSALRFERSRRVVHSDESVMPDDWRAWSAWNIRLGRDGQACFSFWMNRLLSLRSRTPLFVTIDPQRPLSRVWAEIEYATPLLDARARRAQRRLSEISGVRGTWYCGAWWGDGLQEDGYRSGINAATELARWQQTAGSQPTFDDVSAAG